MNTIKRDVYVLRDTIKIPIEVTKGTDMVGFEFAVRDYSIPGTAAAVVYVYHKSMDKPKGILCDINDSTISFTPDNNFFAVGMNELQIRVINNGKSLISFKEKIKCSDAMGFPDDEEENQETLVEQLLTKVGKEEGDRKTADDTEREERIAADDAEKKARIAEETARAKADEAIRANRIVTLDEIDLVTEEGFFVDALAVAELNSKKLNKTWELCYRSSYLTEKSYENKTLSKSIGAYSELIFVALWYGNVKDTIFLPVSVFREKRSPGNRIDIQANGCISIYYVDDNTIAVLSEIGTYDCIQIFGR